MNNLDFDYLRSCESKVRDKILRNHLGEDKCKVIDKYELVSNNKLYWQKVQEKYPTQEYFSHKLAYKSSVLGLIFHIHRLCYAKVKYFEDNWTYYQPCKYYWNKNGFVDCEMYDMEAIRQKDTGIVIDLRDLGRIKWLYEFHDLCNKLEKMIEDSRIQVCEQINILQNDYVVAKSNNLFTIRY
jgi:hypothetical protein